MLKFFKYPWAVTGTRTAIPATDPGTGEMNYQTGYPAPYQLPKTDPASRNIERDKFNELQYDITNELRLLQSYGVPDFISAALNDGVAFEYDVGATCLYLGRQYISRKTANTSLPSVAADWSLVRLGGIPKATAGGTGNAVTADFLPDLGALADGDQILIQHTAANTGAMTINPDGAGALTTYKGAGLPLAVNDVPGADYWGLYVYDLSAGALQMLNPATGVNPAKDLASVTATAAANALTVGIQAETIAFRPSPITSGVSVLRATAAGSLVVPAGASLGAANGASARFAWGWIDNAGTLEVFIVNISGAANLDETGLVSTVAISAGAVTAGVFYSTTARANVAFRIRGFCDILEAAAGTYASQPTKVQPAGGQALAGMGGMGYGNYTGFLIGQRALGTTYRNDSGKPRIVNVCVIAGVSAVNLTAVVGGVTLYFPDAAIGSYSAAYFIVQPGKTYQVNSAGTWYAWVEEVLS